MAKAATKKKTEKKQHKFYSRNIEDFRNASYYSDEGRFYSSERARRARYAGYKTIKAYEESETFLKRSAAAKKGAAKQKAKRDAIKKKAEENPIQVTVKTDVQIIMHALVKTDYGKFTAREMPLEIKEDGKVVGFNIDCQKY